MSRTNKTSGTLNPANKFIKLSGTSGKFEYWDKEAQRKVALEYPITFLPLDVLIKIGGYNSRKKMGIYSNEIHNILNEKLNVRYNGGGELATGLYRDIKDTIIVNNGKFANSVYAMIKKDDGFEIVNFMFIGASLSPFIEFTQETKDIYANAIKIVDSKQESKGAINYYVPVFKEVDVSKETSEKADEFDKILQSYFADKIQSVEDKVAEVRGEEPEEEDDDLPF